MANSLPEIGGRLPDAPGPIVNQSLGRVRLLPEARWDGHVRCRLILLSEFHVRTPMYPTRWTSPRARTVIVVLAVAEDSLLPTYTEVAREYLGTQPSRNE